MYFFLTICVIYHKPSEIQRTYKWHTSCLVKGSKQIKEDVENVLRLRGYKIDQQGRSGRVSDCLMLHWWKQQGQTRMRIMSLRFWQA